MKIKKLHFVQLDKGKRKWLMIIIPTTALICILVGGFEFIEFENPKINDRISSIGMLGVSISIWMLLFRLFRYKYVAQWSKKWIQIKTKLFQYETLGFDEIVGTKLDGKTLTVLKKNELNLKVDLTEISESDILKLDEIINNNIMVKKAPSTWSLD